MKYQTKFWQNYFKHYDVLLQVIPYKKLFKKIVSHLQLHQNCRILDLGSGTGNLKYFLPENSNLVSLDYSQEALGRLEQKFPNSKTIYHSIYNRLPFEDNSIDRIVSNNVLYTLKKNEWDFVLSEIKRIMTPNGIIVISNLNADFKAINIYKEHIRMSLKSIGFANTIQALLKLVVPTIQMLRYNAKISKDHKNGTYSFMDIEEQLTIFKKHEFKPINETELVYANQASLNSFKNSKE